MGLMIESLFQAENSAAPISNGSFPLETSINTFLQYFLPTVTGINIPLVITNLVFFLNTGILNSPSKLIYFNLVLMDMLNSAVGIMVSDDLVKNTNHTSANPWDRTRYRNIDSYIFYFAFDANILLVFGLCLIRVLWTEMSALDVIKKLRMISVVTVGLAYLTCLACFVHAYLEKPKDKRKKIFSSVFVEAIDIVECALIVSIIVMSIYTQVRIRLNMSRLNNSNYKRASKASCMITLNFVISYSYHIAHCAARIYYMGIWKPRTVKQCPPHYHGHILVCDELYLGVTFMCIHSLVNSLILIGQVRNQLN